MIPAHKYPSAIPITVLTLFTIFAALGAFTGILLARKYQRTPNVSDDVKHPLDWRLGIKSRLTPLIAELQFVDPNRRSPDSSLFVML